MIERAGSVLEEGGPKLLVARVARTALGAHSLPARIGAVAKARVLGIPMVHVIGDSHTHVLKDEWPFVPHHLGAATAYNLVSSTSSTESLDGLQRALRRVNARRDVVLLVFGEIDCRIHLHHQYVLSEGSEPVAEIIDRTVERYGRAIRMVRDAGYRVYVQGVVGAAHQTEATSAYWRIPGVSRCASISMRGALVVDFNERLKSWCANERIGFLDLSPAVSDARGILSWSMTEDGTHLDKRAMPLYRVWLESLLPRHGRALRYCELKAGRRMATVKRDA